MGFFGRISAHGEKVRLQNHCLSLFHENKFLETKDCCEKYFSIEPNNPHLTNVFAFSLWMLKRPEDALKVLDRGLLLNPNDYLLLINKTRILIEMNKETDALLFIEKNEKVFPGFDKRYLRGVIFNRMHRYDEALEYLEAAAEGAKRMHPGLGDPYLKLYEWMIDYQKGLVHLGQDNFQKALELLDTPASKPQEGQLIEFNRTTLHIGSIEYAERERIVENIKKNLGN